MRDSTESAVNDHCVKEFDRTTNDGTNATSVLLVDPALPPASSSQDIHQNEPQQLVETRQQPDHLIQSNDNQHDKNSSNGVAADSLMDDNNDCGLVSRNLNVVQPSSVDATTPLILKYSRESDEKPPNVQSHHDDMKLDGSLLICEFCGAVINPDFTPVHDKDHTNSSDSEEVSNI